MIGIGLSPTKSIWSYNPIPNGCTSFAPLWHPNLHGSVVKSIDSYGQVYTRTGGVMSGDGVTMDGDDRITIPTFIGQGTAFSLIIRFKQITRADSRICVANADNSDSTKQGIGFGIAAGTNYLQVVNDGVAWGSGTTVPDLNTWYTAMFTQSGTVSNLYVDGGAAVISTYTGVQEDAGGYIYLGAGVGGSDLPNYHFKGAIREVIFFNRVLSAVEWSYAHSAISGR